MRTANAKRRINMNKLNIKEYKTKSGEVRYILRGAYIGTDVLTGKQVRTSITGRTKKTLKLNFNVCGMILLKMDA